MSAIPQQASFRLELSNNQNWNILAETPAQAWAERIAAILQLKEGRFENGSRLIFRKNGSAAKSDEPGPWKPLHLEHLTLWSSPETMDVICDVRSEHPDIFGIWESIYPIYRRARLAGGLPMHAGLVEKDGIGILLAGASRSGKSTCCSRIPLPWNVICDEEVLLLYDPEQAIHLAHPFPTWSKFINTAEHFSWDVQKPVPVKAIFFLEKAQGDALLPLGQGRTAMSLFSLANEKCHIDWERTTCEERVSQRVMLFENACRMADPIPGYILRVSRFGAFWEIIDEALKDG